jgi:hypothetical protein
MEAEIFLEAEKISLKLNFFWKLKKYYGSLKFFGS